MQVDAGGKGKTYNRKGVKDTNKTVLNYKPFANFARLSVAGGKRSISYYTKP